MSGVQAPPIIEDAAVAEMVRIGMERLPHEACGVWIEGEVFEVPNSSPEPADAFIMTAEDIREVVGRWLERHPDRIGDPGAIALVGWHTHPNDFAGPSKMDLETREAQGVPPFNSLVVALPSGRAILY